ncbi:MAG: methyltransferase domain-containing protein [Candidatus Coatesbacteria bacterium]
MFARLRPWIDRWERRRLAPETLARLGPDLVLGERGFPQVARRRWACGGRSLRDATVLVQGTGNGWDVAGWAGLRPRRIVGVDLFDFGASWGDVARHCRDRHGVEVSFHASPLESMSFLETGSMHLAVSDAVFEHVKDMPSVLREAARVLRDGGSLYASYGPMWYCAGGDHFARGGLRNAYNHLLLDPGAYRRYLEANALPVEDVQSGRRYAELDLFSRLRTDGYLEAFRAAGFQLDGLILELSTSALQFRRRFPAEWMDLRGRCAGCHEDDFLIKTNFVRLRKSGAS